MEGPPRRGGGGMHVGPDDPIFSGRQGLPGLPGSGPGQFGPSHPGGARWDPIAPPGMPGFLPDSVDPRRRGGPPAPHPDIMQPGPGRSSTGADFGFM